MLGYLTYSVYHAGAQFYDNKLFVISSDVYSYNNEHNQDLQSFDLSTNTTKTYSKVIENGDSDPMGLLSPASYIFKSNLTFFGGWCQTCWSIQQTLNLDDIKPSTQISSDDSDFEELLYGHSTHPQCHGEGSYIECFKVFSSKKILDIS